MIHQPLGGIEGQATDIEIHTKEILRIREIVNKIMAEATGQPLDKIGKDTDRNYFMSAEEAKAYGIIDDVISHSPATKKGSK
jgi:ATP-dependent Clp protease protease subunit